MLFTPENAAKVMRGLKTQTRRPNRGYTLICEQGALSQVRLPGGRLLWEVGRSYAVQPGRGKYGLGSFQLTALRAEKLNTISLLDILAEGVDTSRIKPCILVAMGYCGEALRARCLFADLWDCIYGDEPGLGWAGNPTVLALTMDLNPGAFTLLKVD